jgi:hypothetical protein
MILYLDNLICTVDIVDEEPYFLWICCNKFHYYYYYYYYYYCWYLLYLYKYTCFFKSFQP